MGVGRVLEVAEWKKLQVPDVYFTYEYHRTSALIEQDYSDTLILEWKDKSGVVYLPLILRSISGTKFYDAISAYGYGGPWVEGSPDLEEFQEFFEEWTLQRSIVCTFIRFHPLIDNADTFSHVFPVESVGPTAGWDLDQAKDLVAGMAKGHRKTFRRAFRDGVKVRVTQKPREIEDFIRLYESSMSRVSADDFYRFPREYWYSLQNSLGDDSLLVEAILDGETVATVWCITSDDYLHFHLSGTTDQGRNVGASVACRLTAAEWAQSTGRSLAHFGGGVGGADSQLLTWKKRFDEKAELYDFCVAKIVHNQTVFTELSQSEFSDGFFPPWRDPRLKDTSL